MEEIKYLPINAYQAKVLWVALHFFSKENEIIIAGADFTNNLVTVIELDENAKELQDELTARFGLTITE